MDGRTLLARTAIVAAALACCAPAQATTYSPAPSTPDVLATGDGCSLREAITAANTDAPLNDCPAGSGRDTINLAPGTYTLGVGGVEDEANQSGDLDITAPLDIKGAGSCNTTIDAAGIDRVIDAKKYDNDVTITGLTITGGRAPDSDKTAGPIQSGGGIRAQAALTLSDVVLKGNAAGDGLTAAAPTGVTGGDGGGIYAGGPLTIKDSSITGNHAGKGGPGQNAPTPAGGGAGGSGGGIWGIGKTTIINTLITANKAGEGGPGGFSTDSSHRGGDGGGAGRGGGIEFSTSPLEITRSRISDNEPAVGGPPGDGLSKGDGPLPGGVAALEASYLPSATIDQTTISGNSGGATPISMLSASGSQYTIKNSTITGNGAIGTVMILLYANFKIENTTIAGNASAQSGQGLDTIELYQATATVSNSTIANNEEMAPGIIRFAAFNLQGANVSLTLANSIVANNGNACSWNGGPVTDGGHNIIWPDDANTCPGTKLDPKLATLADNSGPTQTLALQVGSPAIDAVPAASCAATDQRGASRPVGSACDTGAFELGGDTSKSVAPASGPVCRLATQAPAPVEMPVTPSAPLPKRDLLRPRVGLRLTKQKLLRALRKGYALHFTSSEPGVATAKFRFRGQIVAGGQIAFAKPGKQKLVMIFSPAAKQSLKRRKRVRLRLTLQVSDAAGNKTTRSVFINLKR